MISRDQHAALRAGKITGSVAQRIMTSSRSSWNTIARDIRNPRPFYSLDDTPNMPDPLAWGQRHEQMAAGEFWDRHPEYDVLDPRFIPWNDPSDTVRLQHFGYSPDRLLATAGSETPVGGLETKCPFDEQVHVQVVRSQCVPIWAMWQVYHGIYVSGLDDWWFVSFDPRVQDDGWRYFECRVIPHPRDMERLRTTLDEFLHGFTMGERFTPLNPKAADFDRMF
jgi:hypothetical protein